MKKMSHFFSFIQIVAVYSNALDFWLIMFSTLTQLVGFRKKGERILKLRQYLANLLARV